MPIWVKLPNLPFEYWSEDFLKLVGNTLGSHPKIDLSFLKSGVCCLGRVLVLLDFRNGLAAKLMIKGGNSKFSQPLDYLGIPFQCNRCHVYGHLMPDCSLPFSKKPNSGSVYNAKSVWHVKNGGHTSRDKQVIVKNDGLVDMNLSPNPLINEVDLGSQSVSM